MIDLQDTDQIVFCDTESFAHNWSDWGMPNMNDLPLMSSSHQSYIAVFIEYSLFFSATPIKGLHIEEEQIKVCLDHTTIHHIPGVEQVSAV